MSSDTKTVNLPAVVGDTRRLSKQPDMVGGITPAHWQKNVEPLQYLPKVRGFTSDDPICIDSDEDVPAAPKTEPGHVFQSSIDSPRTQDSNMEGSVDPSKGQHLAKKRPRPSATSASEEPSADNGDSSQPSHAIKGRHYLIRKRITFPATKQEDQVSTANDVETGTWTFRIQKDSDSDSIDVIEILDDSDDEDPSQEPSQPPLPASTHLNLDTASEGLATELEETSTSRPEHETNSLSQTLTLNNEETCLPSNTTGPLSGSETNNKSTEALEVLPPSESSISPSRTTVPLFGSDSKNESAGPLEVLESSEPSISPSPQDTCVDQTLAVPSKKAVRPPSSDDETSSPDDSSDSSGPLNEPILPQQPINVGVSKTIVPKESSKPQGADSFRSHNAQFLHRQYLALLQPPPLRMSMITQDPRTPEEIKWLLSTQERDKWMSSVKSNNFLDEWHIMAQRLRRWQEHEDTVVSQRSETKVPKMSRKPVKRLSQYEYLDPPNFKGGVDPPISARDTSRDLGAMNFVPMYNKQYIDENTGLPCRKFTVIGSPDHIMYSFLLQVRTSSIPNAGYGLFLKFLGAKELKPSKRARGEEIRETRPVNPNILFNKISLFHPRGFGMNLTIKGEHLKAPYNSLYTRRTLQMTLPDDRLQSRKKPTRTLNLKFSDPDIMYDDDELEGLRQPEKRIGHYGLFTEDDFVDAPKRTFSSLHSNCGYIDIGRYGPFLKEDRKIEIIFDVKNFLFGFEPGMWSFGVPEKILGRDQVIDITDDLTGEPHEEARRNLTMYVNEVGHNHSLRETIHALDEDDRTITYFLMIDNCMKKGEEIEVFVNYKQSYEDNRERKGYGKKNLSGSEKSDEHLPSRLRRNFVDRREVLTCIKEAEIVDLYLLVDFCFELGKSLQSLLNDFLGNSINGRRGVCPVCPMTARQITAIRRLDWLIPFLENRNKHLKETLAPGRHQASFYLLNQNADSLSRMRWGRWTELLALLDKYPIMVDKANKNIRTALEEEGVEEVSFEVANNLPMPLHESRWCPLAIDLTYALCTVTARTLWQNLDRRALAEIYFSLALRAANEIRHPVDLSRLAIPFTLSDPFVKSLEPEQYGSLWIGPDGVPKVLVTKINSVSGSTDAANLLMGCQTPMNIVAYQPENIQRLWYLVRQVYVVVDCLAQIALPSFSREHLQRLLGIETKVFQHVLEKDPVDTPKPLPPQPTVRKNKKNQDRDKVTTVKSQKKIGPPRERVNNNLFWEIVWKCLSDKLGWRLEKGNRPCDFYALPPGVFRGGVGFRNRTDFFDSVPLILEFIKKDPKWKEIPEVKGSIDEYYACKSLYDSLVSTKKMPSFSDKNEKIKWLREKVKSTGTARE